MTNKHYPPLTDEGMTFLDVILLATTIVFALSIGSILLISAYFVIVHGV